MHVMRFAPLLAMCVTFGACGESHKPSVAGVAAPVQAAGEQPRPAPAHKTIALVMKTLTNPFFVDMERGAKRAEKELGVTLLVKTASQETSIEQQIQIVEELIQMKVDAIVIAPGDSLRLVPVLKRAQEAGIPIVNIDNRLDPEAMKKQGLAHIPFVSVDNEKAAYESAQFIARSVQKPAQAAIIEGIRSADNSRLRRAGAERAFKENPHITLVATETANWKIDEGYAVTRQLFSAHPDISLLFCANDMMALGALKFLQESGRQAVKVASYDALEEAREAVKSGQLAVTVDQQAAEQGYQGVRLARRQLDGESVPEQVLIDTHLIVAELVQ
ncbi:MAG: sugar ABC transporter substrate-binding protein [Hyalangium sp.]|uniref:sugar ABC transporter substrate-binding protein n=1 Tax=Hyalangium sp. TaxID=2028555 RepID=UPI00389A3F0D